MNIVAIKEMKKTEANRNANKNPNQIANTKPVTPWSVGWTFEELQIVIYDDYSPFPYNLIDLSLFQSWINFFRHRSLLIY